MPLWGVRALAEPRDNCAVLSQVQVSLAHRGTNAKLRREQTPVADSNYQLQVLPDTSREQAVPGIYD